MNNQNIPKGAFLSFMDYFPELFDRETRKIMLIQDTFGLLQGSYVLLENYCSDNDCDCRKVMINVVSMDNNIPMILGTVGFGWENVQHYTHWLDGDTDTASKMVGAYLERGGIQTEYSQGCLEMVKNSLRDEKYIDLIKKHYVSFKKLLKD